MFLAAGSGERRLRGRMHPTLRRLLRAVLLNQLPTTSGTYFVFGNHTFTTSVGVTEQFFNGGQVTVN